eukprot:29389-Eustigmatos_ZCMA.PRE.1
MASHPWSNTMPSADELLVRLACEEQRHQQKQLRFPERSRMRTRSRHSCTTSHRTADHNDCHRRLDCTVSTSPACHQRCPES